MKPAHSLVPGNRWIWWTCGIAFAIGLALGMRRIQFQNEPLPIPASIRRMERSDLTLDHPVAPGTLRGNPPGYLRMSLYSGRELAGPTLAVVEEPPVFGTYSLWLKMLFEEKLGGSSSNFSLKMRGWVTFLSKHTIMHLRSDDGYRIRFRNAAGEERCLVHWMENATEDLAIGIDAEPGRYEIEIDYFNAGGNFYFQFWGTPRAEFEPALDPDVAPR